LDAKLFPMNLENFSCLWKSTDSAVSVELSSESAHDLALSELVAALCIEPRYKPHVERIVSHLSGNVATIEYRQAVFADFMRSSLLCEGVKDVLPLLHELKELNSREGDLSQLQLLMSRLSELELYVETLKRLSSVLEKADVKSQALLNLQSILLEITQEQSFQEMTEKLPSLRHSVSNLTSITVGINLDAQLRPSEATLLSINSQRFVGKTHSVTSFLMQKNPEFIGMTSLNSRDPKRGIGAAIMGAINSGTMESGFGSGKVAISASGKDRMLATFFADLEKMLEDTTRPVAQILKQYIQVYSHPLLHLESEFAFFLGATALIQKLQNLGVAMCKPVLNALEDREDHFEGLTNVLLALRFEKNGETDLGNKIVGNDVHFDDTGRIFILTGPNSGGKTTFIQAVGLVHVLCQAGFHVPAKTASISPIDSIYTHFPVEEKSESVTGRLGEEAGRLNALFHKANQHSLVLLNESLSSTSPGEGVYLARDILKAFRHLGVRAIFATHMHELADVDAINQNSEGSSDLASLVSVTKDDGNEHKRTYRIERTASKGISYASDVARKYAISYEQLLEVLEKRNL
jgi:DNA mismatch repair protein MutS